jgi:hypothetical protein
MVFSVNSDGTNGSESDSDVSTELLLSIATAKLGNSKADSKIYKGHDDCQEHSVRYIAWHHRFLLKN